MLRNRNPSLQRSIGKFYSTLTSEPQLHPNPRPQLRPNPTENQSKPIRSKSKSVGRIYSTGQSLAKQKYLSNTRQHAQPLPLQTAKKGSYSNMINYQQMENKISSYLESTMRISGRQKYNYLASHPSQQYQSHHLNVYTYQKQQTQPLREIAEPIREQVQLLRQQNLEFRDQNQPLKEQKYNNTMKNIPIYQKKEEKILKNSRRKDSKEIIDINKHANKENMYFITASSKKENNLGLVGLNHQQHKNQLENKLKKIINSYESKNKQLSMQLQKIQSKNSKKQQKPAQAQNPKQLQAAQIQNCPYKAQQLSEILEQLKQFNLKGANITKQPDQRLQQIWKSIHQQITSDENLRIIKCFINEDNLNQVCAIVNQNRLKKIDISCLKAHQEEYDPFLIEKFHQLMKSSSPNLTHKSICKWISENFTKIYDLSQKSYLKNLNTQKFQCSIRALSVQRELGGLRRLQSTKKDLQIRDFTRSLSILFKANLRNRNVYLVFNKLKGMPYIGRFIELLDEKAGKGKTAK